MILYMPIVSLLRPHWVYSTEPAQKVWLDLTFALDLFGSFSIKGKGTKKLAKSKNLLYFCPSY